MIGPRSALGVRLRRWRLARWARRPLRPFVGRPHGLGAPLVVSLTSFPPRFATLHYTLRSLLLQRLAADRLVLWVAHGDVDRLPPAVRALVAHGLEIRAVPDVRSYKKLVFALAEFPDAFIATADDDVLYPPTWLGELVAGYDPREPTVVCRRAHRVRREGEGFAPYLHWGRNVTDAAAARPSTDLLPVGVGGVLYPPNALHPDVARAELFTRLCPTADDLWFWWMGRRLGTRSRRVGEPFHPEPVPGTQSANLMAENWAGGNDRQLAALAAAFGVGDLAPD